MPSPWALGGLTLVELTRRVWSSIKEDAVMERAASLSYYFLFALFPTLLFLTALLGLLPVPGLWDTLMTYAAQVLPGDAATLVNRTVSEVVRGASGGLLSVGVLVLTGTTLVYHLAPAIRRRWQWFTPGSVFALLAWLATSLGLRIYLKYFGDYNAMYGPLGGVIMLMLWLYLSGIALLAGAEINSVIEHATDLSAAAPYTPPISGGK